MNEGNALARRWADLWNTDPHQMVDELYAPGVVLRAAGSDGLTRGREDLHTVEDGLLRAIPDHRLEIVRTVQEGPVVAVECLITGSPASEAARMASPAAVWWRLDDDGLVEDEVAYFEWEKRWPVTGKDVGTVREGSGAPRDASWARDYAERLAGYWSTDPVRMVEELYAEDCLVESLWAGPGNAISGAPPLREGELRLLEMLPTPHRRMTVHQVASEGSVIGLRWTIEGRIDGEGPLLAREGSLFLTLNHADRVISDRIYWDFGLAKPVGTPS